MQNPKFDSSKKLDHILQILMQKRSADQQVVGQFSAFWDAAYYGLDRVGLFNICADEEKSRILELCAKKLLEESYFIEKLGLSFNAKMILLSETTQERMLYSFFASEEASHLKSVSGFLPIEHESASDQPFLRLLEEVIQDGQKLSLNYLIQIILEGWGISHYLGLSRGCQNINLKQVLVQIVRDETIHHGSGVTLFDSKRLGSEERKFIFEILVRLFQMVQAGPQFIARSVEKVKGPLSKQERIQIFRELNCEAQSQKRIDLLISLIGKKPVASLVDDLNHFGVLKPLNAEVCATY